MGAADGIAEVVLLALTAVVAGIVEVVLLALTAVVAVAAEVMLAALTRGLPEECPTELQ